MSMIGTELVDRILHGAVVRLCRPPSGFIECMEGCLWVTQSGCPTDWFVEAGHRHRVTGRGVIVVEALVDSRWRLISVP